MAMTEFGRNVHIKRGLFLFYLELLYVYTYSVYNATDFVWKSLSVKCISLKKKNILKVNIWAGLYQCQKRESNIVPSLLWNEGSGEILIHLTDWSIFSDWVHFMTCIFSCKHLKML